ncbi:hypothetical protein AALC75_11130 [Lachnospiraceae bacterium 48-42]
MKRQLKRMSVLAFAIILALQPVSVVQASARSNAANVLKYYKKGDISKAKKYNKKLAKKASKSCIKKLSKKAKAAYRKAVSSYSFNQGRSTMKSLWGYYLADLDGDKKAELMVRHGTCEADVQTTVYKYKNGKAKRIGTIYSGHTTYYDYPGNAGVISVEGHMGYEAVSTLSMKGRKLKQKNYGARDLNKTFTSSKGADWFPFRQQLDDHIKYDAKYHASLILKDLK